MKGIYPAIAKVSSTWCNDQSSHIIFQLLCNHRFDNYYPTCLYKNRKYCNGCILVRNLLLRVPTLPSKIIQLPLARVRSQNNTPISNHLALQPLNQTTITSSQSPLQINNQEHISLPRNKPLSSQNPKKAGPPSSPPKNRATAH